MKKLIRWASVLLLASAAASAQSTMPTANVFWVPVTDAERAMKAPVVEPDAGAEALFWRISVSDEVMGDSVRRVLRHYVRLKIFSEKGIESASKIDLVYGKDISIDAITGRTIKPDGTIVELKKENIHQRDLVKSGGRKVKVKSFALPGVEPGAIVEYRWTEFRTDQRVLYMRLEMQQDFPVQNVTYYLRPLPESYTSYHMSVWPFNCKPSPLKVESNGDNSFTVQNVPAYHPEPRMPGEDNVRPWVLCLYREDDGKREPDKYWEKTGKEYYKLMKESLRTNGEMKAAVAPVVQAASGDAAKAEALLKYIRANFRNVYSDRVTEAERNKYYQSLPKKRLRTSEECFKSGIGTAMELNTLFAALASAVGLDARPAFLADREGVYFDKSLADMYFLNNVDMAIKTGEAWKIYDVSAERLPTNMLGWREEGVLALITDPKRPVFVESPVTDAPNSARRRTAKLKLAGDGTLSGEVAMTYSGHRAYEERVDLGDKAENQRATAVQDDVKAVFSDAVVSEVAIENLEDPEKDLMIRYRVSIPGYAVKTGKRLMLEPLYFQRGETPLFPAGSRKHPVLFHFGWQDSDTVTIEWPEGYSAEAPAAAQPMTIGQTGSYRSEFVVDESARQVKNSRVFTFGSGGRLMFHQQHYPTLKTIFDEVHRRDGVSLVLKQGGGAK